MDYFNYKEDILSSDLSANAKLVALVIASYYNWKNENDAFPSVQTIATNASLSSRSVLRAKKELVEKGYLVSKRRFNKSNTYAPQSPRLCHTVTSMVTQWPTNNVFNNEVNNERKDSNESFAKDNTNKNQEVLSTFDNIFNIFESGDLNEKRNIRRTPNSRLYRRNRESGPKIRQADSRNAEEQRIPAISPTDW